MTQLRFFSSFFLVLFLGACTVTTVDRQTPENLKAPVKKAPAPQAGREVQTPHQLQPPPAESPAALELSLAQVCEEWLGKLPGRFSQDELKKVCGPVEQLPGCVSQEGVPIFHLDREANRTHPERILAFALIHGDEYPSGSVARVWMQRLLEIDPRNEWRVVPILNPDGMKRRTRMNAAGVDLNRNFPSQDWDELAHKYWKAKTKSDPRRNPGPSAGSEVETQCAIRHIEDFKPDLIISIHTPYGVLDFDGPKLKFPEFQGLPWVSLGTFPGSLGRYMWTDRQKPVLTIELKHDLRSALERFDRLQDISGQVALKIKSQQNRR